MKSYKAEILCKSGFGSSEFNAMVSIIFDCEVSDDCWDIFSIRGKYDLLWEKGMPENEIYFEVLRIAEEGLYTAFRKFSLSTILSIAEIESCIRDKIQENKNTEVGGYALARDEYLSSTLIDSMRAISDRVLHDDVEVRESEVKQLMREIRAETGIITHDHLFEVLMNQ